MAEGFSFGAVAFYTRDTVRVRKQAALRERRRILLQQEQQLEESAGVSISLEEPPPYTQASVINRDVIENEAVVDPRLHSEESRGSFLMDEDSMKGATLKQSCLTPGGRQWTYRNLYATSISFMLIFSAFIGLQGLQSSLNAELGSASLSVTYVFYFLIGFVTTSIVRLLGTKYSLLFGYICHLVYIATNYYPEYFTLIPSSVLLGIGSGPVWAGLSTHLGTVAVIYSLSPSAPDTLENLIAKFTGVFFFIFQIAQIVGNLVSSLVLFPYDGNNGTSIVDVGDECNNDEAQSISDTQTYILLSIYLFLNLIGITILLVFVSRIGPSDISGSMSSMVPQKKSKIKQYLTEPFIDLLRVLFSWKMFLLGPLSLYNGMEQSFAFSSYTRTVISECVGVSKVGFALIVIGFFSATTSIVYGRVVKYIPRVILGTMGAVFNLFFLLFLQFYPLRPSFPLIFLFAIFWGTADGIWNTLSSSLVGILFPSHQDSAYSAFRIWMSIGFAIGFAITELKSFSDTIWIMIAVLLLSFFCYFLLEVFNSKLGKRTCCKRSLGVFDGPKAVNELENNEVMEQMLDVGLADHNSNISGSYVPPMPVPRAVTYALGDFKNTLKNRMSFPRKPNSTDTGNLSILLEEQNETNTDTQSAENGGLQQRAMTAVSV